MSDFPQPALIFNSALETGIRSLCILVAGFSIKFDLQQMLAFDHIVVHTGDVKNGPASLHPNVQQRNGELLVRRPIVQSGLDLMTIKGLAVKERSVKGVTFSASEFAPIFLNSLENTYVGKLMERSQWVVDAYTTSGKDVFHEIFNSAFDRWTTEFQFSTISIGGVGN